MKQMVEPTLELARFGSELEVAAIPSAVAERVKLLLVDSIASGLTGWSANESHLLANAAVTTLGRGASTVIGGAPASPGAAALINGYLITARSMCDVHRPTLCHVTPVAVPALLAAAEREASSGRDLLVGLTVALEATVRIGLALDYPEMRSRGWHTPGVAGPLGTALGAARLLGLEPETSARAMGIAFESAGGTFAVFGTPTLKFNQARASLAGLLSADLAAQGFGAPTDVLTAADGGMLDTFSNGGKPDKVTRELGFDWELTGITTRLWPAATALQTVVAMILSSDIPPPDSIESVSVALSPTDYAMYADMGWASPFEAQLSTRYVTSVVLADRSCWLDQYLKEKLTDPKIGAFAAERVHVVSDPDLPEGGARMSVAVRGGDVVDHMRRVPKGHPEDPATWGETADKLTRAAAGRKIRGSAGEIVEMVDSLETLDDVGVLVGLLGAD